MLSLYYKQDQEIINNTRKLVLFAESRYTRP